MFKYTTVITEAGHTHCTNKSTRVSAETLMSLVLLMQGEKNEQLHLMGTCTVLLTVLLESNCNSCRATTQIKCTGRYIQKIRATKINGHESDNVFFL